MLCRDPAPPRRCRRHAFLGGEPRPGAHRPARRDRRHAPVGRIQGAAIRTVGITWMPATARLTLLAEDHSPRFRYRMILRTLVSRRNGGNMQAIIVEKL